MKTNLLNKILNMSNYMATLYCLQMQTAANLSFSYPLLLEQIFQRFSSSTDQNSEKLLLDLYHMLGRRIVQAALQLLEHQTILIYTKTPKTIEVAEITEVGRSTQLVRLFPLLNYCTCKYFQQQVLGNQNPEAAPYTCKHALAFRLAFVLKHKCLHYEEVPAYRLDLLLSYFQPEDIHLK